MEAATARPDLRLVDAETGEVTEFETVAAFKQQIAELEQELRGKRSQITKLKNELAQAMGMEPDAEQIVDVLEFWREKCMPGASIVVGQERWKAVRGRLRDKDAVTKKALYTPLHLKACVVGALLSEFHVAHRKDGYLDAASIFSDSKKVDKHIARATGFKRRTGVSAMALLDELGGTALVWLADRCSCGGLRLEHLRTGEAHQPCADRGCPAFDELNARVENFMAGAA